MEIPELVKLLQEKGSLSLLPSWQLALQDALLARLQSSLALPSLLWLEQLSISLQILAL